MRAASVSVPALVLVLVLAASLSLSGAQAERLDFSGTWRLQESPSDPSDTVVYAGLIAAGAPETLHVTHPANGTLVVESQVNESHARYYVPGERTVTPVFLGTPGNVAVTSRWQDGTLVGEGERTFSTGDAAIAVRESFSLGPDGRLQVALRTGEAELRLTYARISSVGTCESWPSPCKTPEP